MKVMYALDGKGVVRKQSMPNNTSKSMTCYNGLVNIGNMAESKTPKYYI